MAFSASLQRISTSMHLLFVLENTHNSKTQVPFAKQHLLSRIVQTPLESLNASLQILATLP